MRVEFFHHSLGEEDIKNVTHVLRSIFLTTGPVTAEFEKKFSQYIGLKESIGVTSCTAGLHMSLLAAGIGTGDEVITTPMTFIASVTPIIHVGAKPVFVDVEEATGLMDVTKVEEKITSKTKAIVPVHLYGSMVDMKTLRDIANKYGLKIIEDSAHCVEGERDAIRPGHLSDAACYSFYATKNITSGEGGAVGTNDPKLAERIRVLRLHGMSKDAVSRYSGYYRHWDMMTLGWKCNMDDIRAALLIGQIDRLKDCWQRRQEISRSYNSTFDFLTDIRIPKIPGKSARHLYTIWVHPEKRNKYLHQLQDKQIGVAVNYRAIHELSYFRRKYGFKPDDFPIAKSIGDSTISLPLYPCLKDIQVDYVIDAVKEIIDES